MKKALSISAAVAIVAMAGSAFAAANLTVNASVSNTCIIAGSDTLTFPALDPTNPVAINNQASTGGISITCTNGGTYALGYDGGANGGTSNGTLKLHGGTPAGDIPYTLALSAPAANGTAQAVAINGSIAAGAYATAGVGAYSDAVTVSVTAN